MSINATGDPFAAIRAAATDGANLGLDTDDIIEHLKGWQSLCSFKVTEAKRDAVNIEFESLPADLDAFVRDLYKFCPDVVDQGTGCMHEMLESMEEIGEEIDPETAELIDGVDFSNEN